VQAVVFRFRWSLICKGFQINNRTWEEKKPFTKVRAIGFNFCYLVFMCQQMPKGILKKQSVKIVRKLG
jgi:hypothetical protein